jgi:hypothetical protein
MRGVRTIVVVASLAWPAAAGALMWSKPMLVDPGRQELTSVACPTAHAYVGR